MSQNGDSTQKDLNELGLLQAILLELKMIRIMLGEATEIEITKGYANG